MNAPHYCLFTEFRGFRFVCTRLSVFEFKDKSHLLLKVDIHLKVIQVLNMLLSRVLQKNIPKAA